MGKNPFREIAKRISDMEEKMNYSEFDKRDTCLQVSHYSWAKKVLTGNAPIVFDLMSQIECRLDEVFGHRKNRTYKWSNSDGFTRWVYDKFLKYVGVNPYKGLNGDQYRGLFLFLYENIHVGYCQKIRDNIVIGLLCRLGFTPSLMENVIFKPQSYVLLLRCYKYYFLNPLYWICLIAFYFSMKKNLKEPIKGHTTNKITLLPTMKYLGFKMPSDEYIESVYKRYYGKDTELSKLMIKAIKSLTNK